MIERNDEQAVNVRRATSIDAAAIRSVLDDSFVEFRALYSDEAYAATTLDADAVLRRIEEGPFWVAEKNGAIVGTISAVSREGGLYIRSMAVVPFARGSGIGNILLAHAQEYARELTVRRLFLLTTPFLTKAIQLYEHFGFRRVEGSDQDYFGTPVFCMEKDVP